MTSTWRAWAEAATGRRIVRTRRLHGGITSEVRAITFDDGETLVLRQWPEKNRDIFARWIENEMTALTAVEATAVPAPRPITSDSENGRILMTRLPGRVDLSPRDLGTWTSQLAEALPPIHDVRVPAPVPAFEGWMDLDAIEPRNGVHRDAIALARTTDTAGEGLLHTDFQHYNVLWSRGRLTGIVDWAWPSHGAPDLDVGHCLLNVVLLLDVAAAEHLRLAYEAVVGRPSDPAAVALRLLAYGPGWKTFLPRQAIGVALDLDGMDDRVDELLRLTLRRAG